MATGSPTTVHIEMVLVLKEILQLILPTTTAEYDYSIICMNDFKKKRRNYGYSKMLIFTAVIASEILLVLDYDSNIV